jgi:hypothetical protein
MCAPTTWPDVVFGLGFAVLLVAALCFAIWWGR